MLVKIILSKLIIAGCSVMRAAGTSKAYSFSIHSTSGNEICCLAAQTEEYFSISYIFNTYFFSHVVKLL